MSYQEEPSSIELLSRRQPLETAAAVQLGLMLFAFSRLDLHLRLLVEDLDEVSLPTDTFNDRLRRLEAASQRLAGSPLAPVCAAWIVQARAAGVRHETLLRGHWLPDLRRGLVIHVSAVTGSPISTDYTVSDLEAMHRNLHELQDGLQRLAAGERALRVAPDTR